MSDMRSHLHIGPPRFSADGQSLYTLVTREGNVHVYQFALDGTFKILTQGEREIYQFELTSDEQHIIAASTDVTLPGDLFRIAIHSGTEERLTRVNDSLLDEIEISVPECFWTEVEDGRRVQGWVMKPAGFKEGVSYPAILEIHGGPHAMYSNSFFMNFSCWPLRDIQSSTRIPEEVEGTDSLLPMSSLEITADAITLIY